MILTQPLSISLWQNDSCRCLFLLWIGNDLNVSYLREAMKFYSEGSAKSMSAAGVIFVVIYYPILLCFYVPSTDWDFHDEDDNFCLSSCYAFMFHQQDNTLMMMMIYVSHLVLLSCVLSRWWSILIRASAKKGRPSWASLSPNMARLSWTLYLKYTYRCGWLEFPSPKRPACLLIEFLE